MKKLTIDDIDVPKGMLDAGMDACLAHFLRERNEVKLVLASALLWLAENGGRNISLRDADAADIAEKWNLHIPARAKDIAAAVMRRMFLKPKPELPEKVKALLWEEYYPTSAKDTSEAHNEAVAKAYELGKQDSK